MARYLEAFKTSLGDITPEEWNTLDGLADEDTMGAATRATMMVRHSLTQCACTSSSYFAYYTLIFYIKCHLILFKEP